MTNQQNEVIEKLKAFGKQNWKVITALFIGLVIGGIIGNRNIKGISFDPNGISWKDGDSLPQNLSIDGEWVYKTDVQEKFLRFAEKKCVSVVGTVDIVQPPGSSIFEMQGWRRVCVDIKGAFLEQKISWSSDIAVIAPRRNKLFFWLKTTDNPAKYGFVSALVTQPSTTGSNNSNSQQIIKGTMYYLNEIDHSWTTAQIYLYRGGTSEASQIKGKYFN